MKKVKPKVTKKAEKKFQPEIIFMDPKKITPYAKNSKVHSDEQIDRLAGVISAFGFTTPIVVDEKGVIIAGHGRREAALRLNLDKVPVIKAGHLDEHQVMAARIADNKVASTEYDLEMLGFDVKTLERLDFDLSLTGLALGELDKLLKDDNLATGGVIGSTPGNGPVDNNVRQLTFVMEKDDYERILGDISRLMKEFDVETNTLVLKKLIVSHDSGGTFT